MIAGFTWPDLVIGAILALTTFKGFARGFVKEIGGLLALAAFLIAPHFYNGSADAAIDGYTKLGATGSHLAGMLMTGIAAYLVVLVVAALLDRIAKLPVLGIGNSLAGAALGFAKGAIAIWLALYVALFFPLTPEIRQSLHASRLAPYFTEFDGLLDAAIESAVPEFARPMIDPYFARHHP